MITKIWTDTTKGRHKIAFYCYCFIICLLSFRSFAELLNGIFFEVNEELNVEEGSIFLFTMRQRTGITPGCWRVIHRLLTKAMYKILL